MDASEIQQLRAMLAAQAMAEDARPRGLLQKLSRLLTPATWETPSPLDLTPEMSLSASAPMEGALWLTAPSDATPAEILLGDFCPRRPAFGQRTEPSLEPEQTLPSLAATDSEAELGILLQDGGMAIRVPPRRRNEPLHAETPFFPEDLADDPDARRPSALLARALTRVTPARSQPPVQAVQAPPAPPPEASPPPELAGVFLLAGLAARLASEDQTLRQSLQALPERTAAMMKTSPPRRRPRHPERAQCAVASACAAG